MLMVFMHNDDEYLRELAELLTENKARKIRFVRRPGLGSSVTGDSEISIFRSGKMMPAYDKAVIAVVKERAQAEAVLEAVDNSSVLKVFNLGNRGFVLALPYSEIEEAAEVYKKEEVG